MSKIIGVETWMQDKYDLLRVLQDEHVIYCYHVKAIYTLMSRQDEPYKDYCLTYPELTKNYQSLASVFDRIKNGYHRISDLAALARIDTSCFRKALKTLIQIGLDEVHSPLDIHITVEGQVYLVITVPNIYYTIASEVSYNNCLYIELNLQGENLTGKHICLRGYADTLLKITEGFQQGGLFELTACPEYVFMEYKPETFTEAIVVLRDAEIQRTGIYMSITRMEDVLS